MHIMHKLPKKYYLSRLSISYFLVAHFDVCSSSNLVKGFFKDNNYKKLT